MKVMLAVTSSLPRLFAALALPAVAIAGSSVAQAQYGGNNSYNERSDIMFNGTPVSADEWIVTVRGTIGVSSAWPGADRASIFGSPSISYRHVGERVKFASPDDSAGMALHDTSWLRVGVVAAYVGGRYSGSQRRLMGIHDAGWSVQPGLFVDMWPTEFLRARIEARYAVGNAHGFVGSVGADFVQKIDRLTLAVGPRLKWGSQKYTNDMYGVRFQDALNTAGFVTPYKASGGVNSLGVVASASYDWSDELTTTVFGGYDRLVGSAANSPIVKRFGSRNQYSAGVSAAYSFNMRPLW